MADPSFPRQSMRVTPDNTKNLRSKFEQFNVIAERGDSAVAKRKGATLPRNFGKPQVEQKPSVGSTPNTVAGLLSPRSNNSTSNSTTVNSFSRPGTIGNNGGWSQYNSRGNAPLAQSKSGEESKRTSMIGIGRVNPQVSQPSSTSSASSNAGSTTVKPSQITNNVSNIPTIQTPPVTTTTTTANDSANTKKTSSGGSFIQMGGSGDGDSFLRTKPLVKPKPDLNRQTVLLNPQQVQQQMALLAEQQKKEQEAKAAAAAAAELLSSSMSVEKPADSVSGRSKNRPPTVLEIDEKWRINYEDLEFDELVSAGSAGEVYLGYYFGTPVAIKKLLLGDSEKHLVAREYAMLQGVNHPNIVQFLGICDHSSGIHLITEYIEHGDLFDLLIFSDKKPDWKNKVKIALQIAQACFYLHSKNIIHRDLKSQNVLIADNYKVKLCDLGLATVIESNRRMTVCGTNEWMAPEIAVTGEYDGQADVFSFAIVLTEMIGEQPPAKRSFEKQLAFDVEQFKANLPAECPPEFAQLVIECAAYNPKDRPTFREIVQRLRALQTSLDD